MKRIIGALFLIGNCALACSQANNANIVLNPGGTGAINFTAGNGSITSIVAGAGLAGGGNLGTVNLAVDPTLIPFLTTANSFIGNQTVTGYVDATSFQMGGVVLLPSGLLGYKGAAASYLQLQDGTGVSGHCAQFSTAGILTDSGVVGCTGGGGGSTWATLPGGTSANTYNVGTGGSLQPTGSGTITANLISGAPSATFNALTAASAILTGLGNSTSPVCPNGVGNALTTSGCVTGSGSGTVSNGTGGRFTFYPSTGTTVDDDANLDDGLTTANVITAKEPVAITDGSGVGGGFSGGFGTAIAGSGSTSALWADSTASRWLMNNANAGALAIPGTPTTAVTAGHLKVYAANGFDDADGGTPSSGSVSFITAIGTVVKDAGMGSGGTATASAGAVDGSGFVTITVGTSPTGGTVGFLTINYGGTFTTAPHCDWIAQNSAAMALNGTAQQPVIIPGASQTTVHFLVSTGSSAMTAGANLYYFYNCHL